MFETEAGFAETKMLINCNGDYSKKQDYKKGWQDGAEFGYSKAKEECKVVVEHFEAYGQCRDSRRIASLEAENKELKRDKEDLIFIRDQRAKCMCEDKERLTQATEILRKYHEECPKKYSFEDIDDMVEQFLKETKDIREDSTYKGDWVVDEH